MGLLENMEMEFVFKRAFRFGACAHKDFIEAFGKNAKASSRRIAQAIGSEEPRFKGLLRKERGKAVPMPGAKPPACADEADLANGLLLRLNGQMHFAMTGLREDEINAQYAAARVNAPQTPGVLLDIIKCIGSKHDILKIEYVSLSRDYAREDGFMRIKPLGVQVIGDQISVHAARVAKFDPESLSWIDKLETRTLVLSRIISAEIERAGPSVLKRLKMMPAREEFVSVPVEANPEYHPTQKIAIEREFNVVNGHVKLLSSAQHHFMRENSDKPLSKNAIWPPLISKKPGYEG